MTDRRGQPLSCADFVGWVGCGLLIGIAISFVVTEIANALGQVLQ